MADYLGPQPELRAIVDQVARLGSLERVRGGDEPCAARKPALYARKMERKRDTGERMDALI